MKTSILVKNQEDLIENKKGFIVGASEDGTLYYNQKKNAYILEIEQANVEWLDFVKKAFLVSYNKNCKVGRKKSGYFRLSCYSKKVYNDLIEIRKDFSRILKKSKDYKIGFLQGVFDAEGSVHNKRFGIRIYSNNSGLISIVRELLKQLDITTGKIYIDKRTNVLMLPIYGRQNLQKFQELINFNHIPKKYRLKNLLQQS